MEIVETLDPCELAIKQKILREMFKLHIEICLVTLNSAGSWIWTYKVFNTQNLKQVLRSEGQSDSYESILRHAINRCIEYLRNDTSYKG